MAYSSDKKCKRRESDTAVKLRNRRLAFQLSKAIAAIFFSSINCIGAETRFQFEAEGEIDAQIARESLGECHSSLYNTANWVRSLKNPKKKTSENWDK